MTTKYINYGVTLSNNQIRSFKKARDKNRGLVVRLARNSLSGTMNLPLTVTQINKIKKSKNGVQLKLSKSQIRHMEKTGGFLPLLALLPAILGAAGGLTAGIASAVNSTKQVEEQKRHNMNLEKLAATAQGSGVLSNVVEPVPIIGSKLAASLRKIGLGKNCCVTGLRGCKWGNGVYLEREGTGLFLERPAGRN